MYWANNKQLRPANLPKNEEYPKNTSTYFPKDEVEDEDIFYDVDGPCRGHEWQKKNWK